MLKKISLATALGTFLGVAGSYALFLQIWTLVPWGIAGIALGYGTQRGERLAAGACYGFALSFTFMIANYSGAYSLISRLPVFALMGLFGSLCGMLLSLIGFFLKKWSIQKSVNSNQ
jgi:hypothetical protein